jgi:hypothetical protein
MYPFPIYLAEELKSSKVRYGNLVDIDIIETDLHKEKIKIKTSTLKVSFDNGENFIFYSDVVDFFNSKINN